MAMCKHCRCTMDAVDSYIYITTNSVAQFIPTLKRLVYNHPFWYRVHRISPPDSNMQLAFGKHRSASKTICDIFNHIRTNPAINTAQRSVAHMPNATWMGLKWKILLRFTRNSHASHIYTQTDTFVLCLCGLNSHTSTMQWIGASVCPIPSRPIYVCSIEQHTTHTITLYQHTHTSHTWRRLCLVFQFSGVVAARIATHNNDVIIVKTMLLNSATVVNHRNSCPKWGNDERTPAVAYHTQHLNIKYVYACVCVIVCARVWLVMWNECARAHTTHAADIQYSVLALSNKSEL